MAKAVELTLTIGPADTYYVESDGGLFEARDWILDRGVKSRVIKTVVGAYGAVDGKFGTTYFDVGDALVFLPGFASVTVVKKSDIDQAIKEAEIEKA